MSLFPLMTWDLCENAEADAALEAWGHWLGSCNRPFGRQSFALRLESELVAVAVSASTVGVRCSGYERGEVVELARLCAHPDHRDLTRVALRLWRKTAPAAWSARYWPVKACVSYANSARHTGDIYRFDGWQRGTGGKAGVAPNHGRGEVVMEKKTVWVWPVQEAVT